MRRHRRPRWSRSSTADRAALTGSTGLLGGGAPPGCLGWSPTVLSRHATARPHRGKPGRRARGSGTRAGPRQLLGGEAVRDMSTTNGHIDTLELHPRLPRCRPVRPACGPRWKQAARGGEPLAPRPWRRRASIMPAGICSRRSRPRVRTSKNGLRRRRRPASASSAVRGSRGPECIDFDARAEDASVRPGGT